ISVAEAAATILAHIKPLDTERLPCSAAFGRVLAEPVHSAQALPPFNSSTVDGYAVLSGDSAERRKVLAIVTASRPVDEPVAPGTAIRIMTGAPVPPGADAVIMQEYTREDDGHVVLERGVRNGENINPRGADIADGQAVLQPGTCLGPAELG